MFVCKARTASDVDALWSIPARLWKDTTTQGENEGREGMEFLMGHFHPFVGDFP